MNAVNRMILEDYRKERDNFVKLGDIVQTKLEKICKDLGIIVMAVNHRVKTEDSLAGKLARYEDKYHKLSDLTDLLGCRIICYFEDQVDIIGKKIEQEFNISWDKSSDKRKLLDASTFGYLSLHYICTLKAEEGYDEALCNKEFELQIRTNLQHTWSEINHDLGYKSQFGVPREIARSFARIASLLEIADGEFVHVRNFMGDYTADIRRKIKDNTAADVHIDRISIKEYMSSNIELRAFLSSIAAITGAQIEENSAEGYLDQLMWLGKETLGDLDEMIKTDGECAYKLAESVLKDSELDIITSTTALYYLCRAELICKDYSEEKMKEFLLLSNNNQKRAETQAKRLLAFKERA